MENNSYIANLTKKFIQFFVPDKATTLTVVERNKNRVFTNNKKIYDYIILLNVVEKSKDIQLLLEQVHTHLSSSGRLLIIYRNFLHTFFERKSAEYNWLSTYDIEAFLRLADFEKITHQPLCFIPFKIPVLTGFINRLIIHLFPVNHLSFLQAISARKVDRTITDKTVSIVIPARNEEGNIETLFKKLPPIGTKTEIIFVEGHSKDNTLSEIKRCVKKYKNSLPFTFTVLNQKGTGKADAVRQGFDKAKGDILMIYDADMSVNPNDLNKFYLALISHKGEFINGSRLVYPMQKNAMQLLNILGNKVFSILYSWILGQKIKDTLCGTKVLWKKDYDLIKNEDFFGRFDPFGDFELLLGAGKLNLKIIDLPIRYFERTYGSTNIKRFKNGFELARFSVIAIKKLKMRL